MKAKAVIFTGNSISHEDAKKILMADYQLLYADSSLKNLFGRGMRSWEL
ncbi:hypothetical protein [Methanosarcina horonobensis]